MDIKTGTTVVLLFALFNKVAGVYGLIAIFTGGTLAQVTMYIYSVLGLLLFVWGLRAVAAENQKDVFYFAHAFVCDHVLSSLWLAYFSVNYWVYTEHNGERAINSKAQKQLIDVALDILDIPELTPDERHRIAQDLWNTEKGHAAAVIAIGWLLKIYFALIVYSYALHLRRGTYRALTRSEYGRLPQSATFGAFDLPDRPEDFELDEQELYTPAGRSGGYPQPNRTNGSAHTGSYTKNYPNGNVVGNGDVVFEAGAGRS